MYILFYPLKFPSTPVLIPFKVLQHHNNLLWPRAGLEPAFIHRYRDYLQTCAYFLIQHLAARDTVSPPVRLCILHTPLRLGATFPFAYQVIWSGRQDSNLRPPVPKTGVLANWTTSRNVWFSIILRITTNPENSFRLLPRLTFTEGLHWSVHYHCGIVITL